jgi:WD40 repeat protein/Tfp pilus assembly protein PilF
LRDAATTLDFSRDGRLLATAGDDGVHLWDVVSGREVADLRLDHCETAAFHPSGQSLVTYGKASSLRLWPLRADAQGALLSCPPQELAGTLIHSWQRACWSRDGRWLGVVDERNDTAYVLNLEKPAERRELGSFQEIGTIALSPDGQWAAAGAWSSSLVRIWHLPETKSVRDLPGYSHAAFSPDGQWLVTGGRGEYRCWRVGTWEPGWRLPRDHLNGTGLAPLAFSADNSLLALTRSPNVVQLIDPATGSEIATLSARGSGAISWLCFSPDGSQLGEANGQEGVHLWNLRAIRQELANHGLDWQLAPYPRSKDPDQTSPVQVQVVQDPKEAWRFEWNMRGRYHDALRQWSEAVLDYTEALKVLPPDATPRQRAELLQMRALDYRRMHAYEAALADLQKIVELTPDSAVACHELARFYVTGPEWVRDPDKAFRLAWRALELMPGKRLYHNTLGVVYYRLGQYAQAMETLQRNLRRSEGERAAFDLFLLAMCHARRGEAVEAQNSYDRAVQWQRERAGKLRPEEKDELDAFHVEAQALLQSKVPGPPLSPLGREEREE